MAIMLDYGNYWNWFWRGLKCERCYESLTLEETCNAMKMRQKSGMEEMEEFRVFAKCMSKNKYDEHDHWRWLSELTLIFKKNSCVF